MADLPPVERPIDPNNPNLEAQRKVQLERYLRGEIIFPGQCYNTAAELESALARVMASHRLPEKRVEDDSEALRRGLVELGLEP
jgi:hypothetical protein